VGEIGTETPQRPEMGYEQIVADLADDFSPSRYRQTSNRFPENQRTGDRA
jgi:hypothetical protein